MKSKYSEELNTKKWQDRSHTIKTRDNLTCQAANCKTPNATLQVHHLDYLGYERPWLYPDDMLITLCAVCHSQENYRYKFEESLFTALKMKGFLACDILTLTTFLYSHETFASSLLKYLREKQNG